jgi:protein-S-isoprenylcysteine O-methyltransferase Ste14
MCFKNKIFWRRIIKMKTTNENTQSNHNLKPARLAFLAALMLITFVAAVIPAAAQESPRSLLSAQTAEAVPAKASRDAAFSPAVAAAYCTYTINGTYLLTCYWSRINANSHVLAAISEYANGNPADRFIGGAQMTVHNIAPFSGGVTAEVDVNWGSPLNVRLDLLVD